jgi:rare lipoprotein A
VGGVVCVRPERAFARPRRRSCASRRVILFICAAVAAAGLAGCGSKGPGLGERVIPLGQPVPKGGGSYRVGQPYKINGRRYRPREDGSYDRVGIASWYGELFHGRRTANGEIYDADRLSAASPTLPLPVYAKVTNLDNGRSLVVRVNDRGPYRSNRIIDLSRRSADLLGFRGRGTARVRVQYHGRAPLDGDDGYERRYLASQPWAQIALRGRGLERRSTAVAAADLGAYGRDDHAPHRGARENARNARTVLGSSIGPMSVPSLDWETSAEGRERAQSYRAQSYNGRQEAIGAEAAGRFTIFAGSFRNKEHADRARDLLGQVGPVEVRPIEMRGETVFRVGIGPFASQSEAHAALAQVTDAGYGGARIISR